MSDIQETLVAVSLPTLTKLGHELQKPNTDWTLVQQLLGREKIDVTSGIKLVVPSSYPNKSSVAAVRPSWVILDPPDGTVRVLAAPPLNAQRAATVAVAAPVATPATTSATPSPAPAPKA